MWNLFEKSCERIYTAWNTACRMIFKVPRTTHRYLIETISKCTDPRVFLFSRFVKFHQTVTECEKPAIRTLANLFKSDLRTVYGNNLHIISEECDTVTEDLSGYIIKTKMNYFDTPEREKWRHGILTELLDESVEIGGFQNNEISEMIKILCTT